MLVKGSKSLVIFRRRIIITWLRSSCYHKTRIEKSPRLHPRMYRDDTLILLKRTYDRRERQYFYELIFGKFYMLISWRA